MMLSPFICGSGSFDEDQEDDLACATPKRSTRKNSFCRRSNKGSKNPYSTRGLDKFYALMADLEEKRQEIYSKLDSQETPLVRFVYKDSDDCVPIVVRVKDKHEKIIKKGHRIVKEDRETEIKEQRPERELKRVEKKNISWNAELRRPAYYLPAAAILILLFLAVFGRSAAVLCTSIGWYLVPKLQGERSNLRSSMKKKEHGTRPRDEKKMAVKSAGSSPAGARHSGHRKSF